MKNSLMRFLAGAALAASLPCAAQTYPAMPILMLMPLQAGSAPDGYTVGVLNDSILTMIPNIRQVAYDPVKDFVPVGVVAAITWVMVVSNELPAKSVAEFVALAKSRPGKIDYSSGGNGSPQHVAMEAFKAATGIEVVHIPYRGATQAAVDVMSNRVQVHLGAVSIVRPYILDGRMRALAVPSAARSPLLPA